MTHEEGWALMTPAHRRIVYLVASQGMTTAQMGVVLGCATETVNNLLRQIYERLELRDRPGNLRIALVRWAWGLEPGGVA